MSNVERQPDLKQISVIVPVKNEAATIRQLLQGLAAQTHRPAEIIIADGGSTDDTRDIIRAYQASSSIPIELIETDHAFPGRGRNLAIERARNEWIASIDAGNSPRPDWLSQLAASARREPEAEVIYGIAEPLTNTYFTECAAIAYVPGGRITKFIASCLLRRIAWSKAGGFPEHLRSGEDLLFFKSLETAGVKTANCPCALVIWALRPTLAATFRRFVVYSRNGMKAGLGHEWQYNVSRMYLLLLILLLGSFWFWPLLLIPPTVLLLRAEKRIQSWYRVRFPERLWREMLNPRRVLTVAAINVAIDIAAFYGMWQWLVHDRTMRADEWRPSDHGLLG